MHNYFMLHVTCSTKVTDTMFKCSWHANYWGQCWNSLVSWGSSTRLWQSRVFNVSRVSKEGLSWDDGSALNQIWDQIHGQRNSMNWCYYASQAALRRLLENPNGTVLRTFLALPGASCNAHTWNKADEHLNSHKEHYRRDTLSWSNATTANAT